MVIRKYVKRMGNLVLIPSYPRSGNTFVRIILKNIFGVQSCSVHNDDIFRDDFKEEVGQINFDGQPDVSDLNDLARGKFPIICKTHNLPSHKTRNYPVVLIVRDFRDVMVSYAHMRAYSLNTPERERAQNKIYHAMVKSEDIWGNWSIHTKAWSQVPKLLGFLRYEDLLADPIGEVKKVFGDFLPPQIGKDLPNFEALHESNPHFFREGKTGTWREKLPEEIKKLAVELHGAMLRSLGYELDTDSGAAGGPTSNSSTRG